MTRAATPITLLVLLMLAACARPLSPTETMVAKSLFGDTLDTSRVSVTAGIGALPLPQPRRAAAPAMGEARAAPEDLCVRKRSTSREWRWPAAFVLRDDVFFSYDFYLADTFAGFPESVPYPSSLIMAHELVHVWQWQNRARTGYTVQGSAGETLERVDPYWFVADRDAEFLRYGYEQQGAIVQDFVCYALFDAEDPKRDELAALLRPVLPVDDFLSALEAAR
ncbi:MAG: hypothetical protein KDK11_17680 [Maritimibacter sp.]|nr:hypothetical protein [Maritimibacter sp.]